jgi:hypothetical protein
VFVGSVVVEDEMGIQTGVDGGIDAIQKPTPDAVLRLAGGEDGAVQNVEGGKHDRRSMAFVIIESVALARRIARGESATCAPDPESGSSHPR